MKLDNISFSYKGTGNQLSNISAEIIKGKITTIIGPNGSGKSTLLGVMSRNLAPSQGSIIMDGKAIQEYNAKDFAKKLAMVHQENGAPNDLIVEKLIHYGRIPYRSFLKQDKDKDEQAIEFAIARTNLGDKRHAPFQQLSGGERQRVWLALALAQRTPILFLDEPTTYLDIYYQLEILELVKQLNEEFNMTIVMVLHDINQAIRYSDYLMVMKHGELVMQGATEDVISKKSMKEIYNVDVVLKNDQETGLYVIPIAK
ncbi:ABC transporter ATP-binding protein [Oceanobacillus polygoni]|uniref:Iron complex transport system ATP-binding protein n=1 Tax=Oceanobacillus polygoni TaxID=1235259 RepID=A0A9X0YTM7_9BACI|nr:ABC transporter ATP-binding protein [Oceanobacillus polygoni]MBP2078632.1 iron complex transport system ATP-binding protein [Oceanobacillus polygoni]